MKGKRFYLAQHIKNIKHRILKVAPEAKALDIKIKKSDKENFVSLIKVRMPRGKVIFAKKRDDSAPQCLERAQDAALRQIKKVKRKRRRFRKPPIDNFAA